MQMRPKILVVDDTKTNIEVLEGILSPDYEIYVALNGVKALSLIQKIKPDLVLLDVMMPEMDGYETIRHIKELHNDVPVIFLTSKSDPKSEKEGLALGAVDYIAKPFFPELVILRVKNQIKLKKRRDLLDDQVQEKTKSLRQTLKVMLTSLAALAEYRDNETGMHIRRTQMLVYQIAKVLFNQSKFKEILTSPEIVEFYATAAPLHDIGKVGIQDSILRKPGRLTDEEMLQMQKHTLLGYEVLQHAIADLKTSSNLSSEGQRMIQIAALIALEHHERFDGTGYPQKKKGDEISLCARIMAVADVYDALVSPRIYKKALTHDYAVKEIKRCSGSHFDPEIVKAFLLIADKLPALYREYEYESAINE